MPERKYTTEDLKTMQAWSLERKIQVTQTRLIEWYQKFEGKVYVSFSGGKDSTVLLHIARQLYPDIEAVFVDTGLEYPEIREFVKTFDNVTWLKPEINFHDVIKTYGYPMISKEVSRYISVARRCPNGKTAMKFNANNPHDAKYGGRYSVVKWNKLTDSEIPISHKCCDVMKKKPVKKYEKANGSKAILATMATESKVRKTLGWRTVAMLLMLNAPPLNLCHFGQSRMCLSIYAGIKCLMPLFMVISLKKTASLKPQGATARGVFSADLGRTLKKSQQGFRGSRKHTRNCIITA